MIMEKENKKDSKLQNIYVMDYYNRQVGAMDETYTDARWHSSSVQEFEYRQTSRALNKALGVRKYKNAIEIGPGDGVWTKKIRRHVKGNIHLIEQSEEMLEQAKKRLGVLKNVTFERADFMDSSAPGERDLIISIRCFEYFSEKNSAIKKMFDLLQPGGRLIIVTKNAKLVTSKGVQDKVVHSGQVTKSQMRKLLIQNGFVVESIYPAVFRWKIKYAVMRIIFDTLHRLTIWSKGLVRIPLVYTYATESFVYIASKPRL
jgi:ubiquinone/menaquinone biosynthesis C-methylase UbiE